MEDKMADKKPKKRNSQQQPKSKKQTRKK